MKNPYEYYITSEEYQRAEKNGICKSTLEYRIRAALWERERALTESPTKISEWKMIKEIALKNNIRRSTFESRRATGWTLIDAITKPVMSRKECIERANQFNQNNSILTNEQIQCAKEKGIKPDTIRNRLRKWKWDIEIAITNPALSASESGRRGKEASPWSKKVIPSREQIMNRRKLIYKVI